MEAGEMFNALGWALRILHSHIFVQAMFARESAYSAYKRFGSLLVAALLTACLLALGAFASMAWSQEASSSDDVLKGRHLAAVLCSNCHVAGPDQLVEPVLRPPAPSFETIAQRSATSTNSIRTFMTTTHRGLSNPNGMPNPDLLEFQLTQVAAYLISLRKPATFRVNPATSGAADTTCRTEIMSLETLLSQARANRQAVGSGPESSAARLHRQPTPKSVETAATEVEKTIETALTLARKLESEGMDAECVAMLQKLKLTLGAR
jgi:mono/diheme cytochrome c family protein